MVSYGICGGMNKGPFSLFFLDARVEVVFALWSQALLAFLSILTVSSSLPILGS